MAYPMVKLGDCCRIVSGATPRTEIEKFWDGGILWVTPKDIANLDDPIVLDTPEKITREGFNSCSTQILPVGTILFSSRAPIGHVAISGRELCTNQGFKSLVPSNKVDSRYLYYCMKFLAPRLAELGNGATFKEVSKSIVENFKIPLPIDINEQRRIAKILDKADAICKKRRESLKLADEFLRSVFLDMFGDPVRNPKGWKLGAMNDVICETRCGPFGSALKKDEYVESGIPVWGIDNVHPNIFVEKDTLFITDQKYSELTSYNVKEGDVLISRAGTVGRMCVARPKKSPSIIGTNLIKVSLNHQKMLPEYMTALFTFFSDRIGTMKANNKDNAYSFMKTGILKEIKVPLPSIEKQHLYLDVLKKTEEHRAKKIDLLSLCDNLYNALSQSFFSIYPGK